MNFSSSYCSTFAVPLTQYIKKSPSLSQKERKVVKIDLHQMKQAHPDWTHVLLKILPSKEPLQYYVDIFNPSDRQIDVAMPKWYSFSENKVLDDTVLGSTYYKFKILGIYYIIFWFEH
jgi:glycosylphosphatidylinositol deacylase